MRKPTIYLTVILPILLAGGILIPLRLISYYSDLRGISTAQVPNSAGILITLPAFFLWIPLALMLSNFVVASLPPLRKVAERNVAQSRAPNFAESQFLLFKVFLCMGVVFVPLILYGFAR